MLDQPFAQLRFANIAETERFAACLAPLLNAGDTVLLVGDIGAGKSVLARAIIKARLATQNRDEDIPSPTFTLVQTYDVGDVEIWHCDLYRLTDPQEVGALGLSDAFLDAVTLVEWPDRLGAALPENALVVTLSREDAQPGIRSVTLHDLGTAWATRLSACLEKAAA